MGGDQRRLQTLRDSSRTGTQAMAAQDRSECVLHATGALKSVFARKDQEGGLKRKRKQETEKEVRKKGKTVTLPPIPMFYIFFTCVLRGGLT